MKNVKIICDSLSDVPQKYIEEYNIDIVPLNIIFKEKEFLDGVDITKEELYKILRESSTLPTTSQAPYMRFREHFEQYTSKGIDVLYIGGSSNLSGTYQSGVMAKNDIEIGNIYTFDTLSVSICSGFMAISAAKMARENNDIEEILEHLNNIKKDASIFFTVETLDYLRKGGRVSVTKAAIGNMLNIKPVLSLDDGQVKPIAQIRGKKQSIHKIINLIKEKHGDDFTNKQLMIGCGDNISDLDTLRKLVKEEFKDVELLEVNIASIICAHTGPGVLGIACCDK